MSGLSATEEARLLEVLYEICNYSDFVGRAAFEAIGGRASTSFTQKECVDALFHLWATMHRMRHPPA